MRKRLALLGLVCTQAGAQPQWFTVTGNPADPAVNTVQVDPVAVASTRTTRTMRLRVNRSQERLNWDQQPYRSYESEVLFDCRARRAGYLSATFYRAPLWEGPASATNDYSAQPRPMLFKDMEPNPTGRIVRAACRAAA